MRCGQVVSKMTGEEREREREREGEREREREREGWGAVPVRAVSQRAPVSQSRLLTFPRWNNTRPCDLHSHTHTHTHTPPPTPPTPTHTHTHREMSCKHIYYMS